MKIYINSNYEIKAIDTTEDSALTEMEIDREDVFGNKSDFMILNYCYKPSDNGYSVYPARDYSMLQLLDETLSINSSLKEENNQQEEIIALLTYELMMLQEPIATANLNNNTHSPNFESINSWFNKGYWNEDMLLNAVEKHYITEEEMNEILN